MATERGLRGTMTSRRCERNAKSLEEKTMTLFGEEEKERGGENKWYKDMGRHKENALR